MAKYKYEKLAPNGSIYGAVETGREIMNSNNFDKLTYQHVYYEIPKINLCGMKFKHKRILSDASGIMYHGVNAIMGPTGSGKTTLMDILAARKNKSFVQGQILVNDSPQPYYFKRVTGYVTQDDCMEGTLSVRENIFFSANLRLGSHIGLAEKRLRVQEVIEKLGLTKVDDQMIGTEFKRGVSGGERKRTSIAMELVISPSIIFLDEPTTGLDAYTAILLIRQLKELSNEGKIIIAAIHQPRFAIFNLFDSITLLSRGRTVYHGDAKRAVTYLSERGYECPERENPADFFLDVIAQDEVTNFANRRPERIETLTDLYQNSDIKRELDKNLNRMEEEGKYNKQKNKILWHSTYASNIFWQILVVSNRTLKKMIRTPFEFLLQIIISVFFSVIVGAIYWQLNFTQEGLQNRIGGIFLIVMNQVFANLSAINAFMKDKAIFLHENASGYYRVSAHFFAKLLLDLIPKRLIPIAAGGTIMYFMIGFQLDVSKHFIFVLTLFVTTIAAAGFPFVYGALVNNFAIASLMTALTFVIMMIFGGLLVNITTLPFWLQWIQYLSIFRLAIATLSINELVGLQFNQSITGSGPCGIPSINASGLEQQIPGECYLEQQGIQYGNPFDIWRGIVGLSGFGLGLLILTYIILLLIKKEK